jgi:hypothetical protein
MLMAVTSAIPPVDDPLLRQVNRIVSSPVLHGSDALCKLLRYLAVEAVARPGIPIKEYQIATEVFGRSPDFDPKLDSTVRVQTGRLRSKLTEYYSSRGVDDAIIIEIPKGSYLMTFRSREWSSRANRPVTLQRCNRC